MTVYNTSRSAISSISSIKKFLSQSPTAYKGKEWQHIEAKFQQIAPKVKKEFNIISKEDAFERCEELEQLLRDKIKEINAPKIAAEEEKQKQKEQKEQEVAKKKAEKKVLQVETLNLSKRASLESEDGEVLMKGDEKEAAYVLISWLINNRNTLINTNALHHSNSKYYGSHLTEYTGSYREGGKYDTIRKEMMETLIKEEWIGTPEKSSCFDMKKFKVEVLKLAKKIKVVNGKVKLSIDTYKEIKEVAHKSNVTAFSLRKVA